jgi:plasmid stabilization system protein ParE
MSSHTLDFTRKADRDELGIYNYISEEFGEIYAKKFRTNLIEFCKLLIKQPFIGRPAKNDSTLRVFVFSKQNKIVYKVESNRIIIIRILNIKTNLSSKY